jgi:hypothetical protein
MAGDFSRVWKRFPFQDIRMQIGKVPPTYPGVFERGGIGGLWKTHLQPAWEDISRKVPPRSERISTGSELFQRVLADGKKSLSRHIKKLPISRTYSTPKPLPMMQNNQSRIPIFS